ncbi:MAG TPA: TetR/AcrR family transcriptional regulator [Acidimicrobiia bacterium]|nr:TetR/AcrR family transcriptional regulator [Acidimicrobiia bacterium]
MPRTQADRTATTRAALQDAAIDILVERGWAAVSAVEVCNRAGVSRGAFHHHYANLPQLLADALRRLYEKALPSDPPTITNVAELVDATWAAMSNTQFKAVLEAWLAMANDPSLRDEIGPVVAAFPNVVRADHLAPNVLATDDDRAFYLMARETLLGLALGRATNGGEPLGHEAVVLAQLRSSVQLPGSPTG